MKTLNPTRSLSPAQAEQLAQLLAGATLTCAESVEGRGEDVRFLASVWPSETMPNRFDVMLYVFDADDELLSLADVAFTAASETQEGLFFHVARLTKRGVAALEGLHCHAAYHLHLRRDVGASDKPILLRPAPPYALDAASANTAYVLSGDDAPLTENDMERHPTWRCDSPGGTLRGSVIEQGPGMLLVAVETEEPSLANATVRFAFVDEANRELHSGQVTLAAVEDQPGLWEGRWEGTHTISVPCQLRYEAL